MKRHGGIGNAQSATVGAREVLDQCMDVLLHQPRADLFAVGLADDRSSADEAIIFLMRPRYFLSTDLEISRN